MKWIIAPNKYYDTIKEPYRFLIMLGVYLILVLSLGFRIGFLIFCIIGLWRIWYHILMSKPKELLKNGLIK